MTAFLATRLDLSRLPVKPAVILDLDFEAILAARITKLQELFDAAAAAYGVVPIDTTANEYNPPAILQEADAYRQLLDYALLNDCLRALLPLLSSGTDLDHIAVRAGVYRLTLATGQPEDDASLLMRYLASFGAPSAGSEDAYAFNARSAYPDAQHINVVGPAEHGNPGQIDLVVTAPAGGTPSNDVLAAIYQACNAKNARPATDWVSVIAADLVPYTVNLTATILRGPDPVAVRAAIVANLEQITGERYRGGGQVPRSALAAAAYAAGAINVTVASPAEDIPKDEYAAPYCTSIVAPTIVEQD